MHHIKSYLEKIDTRLYKIVILFLFILLILSFNLNAEEKALKYEVKLLQRIAETLIKKQPIKTFVLGYNVNNIKKFGRDLKVVSNIKRADVIIIANPKYCLHLKKCKKIGIAIGLKVLKNCNFCVAGLYWRKGRPQVNFIKERLKMFHLHISKSLSYFVVSEKDI